MAETKLQWRTRKQAETNKLFNHFSTLDVLWSSAGGGCTRVNVGSTFRPQTFSLICTSGTRPMQCSDPNKLSYKAQANDESTTKQHHLIHLSSLAGFFSRLELPPPEYRGSQQSCLHIACGPEGVNKNSFALMKLIRKGLGQGKCCCCSICSCKFGMRLPKSFLHRANSGKNGCVLRESISCGSGPRGPCFPSWTSCSH